MIHKSIAVLSLFLAGVVTTSADMKRPIRFKTTDNVTIGGTYYPVEQKPAPAVVFIHSVGRTRDVWDDFAQLLQQNGIASLAIDLRGHGESIHKQTADGPVTLELRSLTSSDYQDMLLDVESAVDWLQAQPEIDRKRVAIVGESLGANIALRYAAVNNDLAAVAVFSPGLNYRGLRTDDVITQIQHVPLRIFVSQFDSFAYESCQHLVELQKDASMPVASNELVTCTGNVHGSEMLAHVRNLPQILLSWLRSTFTPAAVAPATGRTNSPPAAATPVK